MESLSKSRKSLSKRQAKKKIRDLQHIMTKSFDKSSKQQNIYKSQPDRI